MRQETTFLASVKALPRELLDSILQEQQQELLDQYHFEITAGNSLLEDAEFICFADTNHIAPDHRNFGGLISHLQDNKSVALVEAVDPNISKIVYDLPDNLPLISWENPEDYYMEILLSDTQRRIVDVTKREMLIASIKELARHGRELIRQREMLAHPERIAELSDQTVPQDPIVARTVGKPSRIRKSYDIIKNMSDRISITERNKPLLQVIQTYSHPYQTRTFLIAGDHHYTEDVLAELNKHKFIVLRATNLPQPSPDDITEYKKPLPPQERTQLKQNWLQARKRPHTPR
jgi:hypothetical protein